MSHEILLKKIEAYGFSESAVDLFASFIKNRQQCKINYAYSEWWETSWFSTGNGFRASSFSSLN